MTTSLSLDRRAAHNVVQHSTPKFETVSSCQGTVSLLEEGSRLIRVVRKCPSPLLWISAKISDN